APALAAGRGRPPAAGRHPAARAPSAVVAPARAPAAAVDLAADRTRRPRRPRRPAPGLLRTRGLRPFERPDPRPRLPRTGPALTVAAAAGRPAGPQARLRGAVAAQCQQLA